MSKVKLIRKRILLSGATGSPTRVTPKESAEVVGRKLGQGKPLSKFSYVVQESLRSGTVGKLLANSDDGLSALLKVK